jgi:hypothetical protein
VGLNSNGAPAFLIELDVRNERVMETWGVEMNPLLPYQGGME